MKENQANPTSDKKTCISKVSRNRRNTVQTKVGTNKSARMNKVEKKGSSRQLNKDKKCFINKSPNTSSTGNLHYKIGVPVKYQSITSPPKQKHKLDITDSDSKKFFEEVFDDDNGVDKLLLDMPLMVEDSNNIDEAPDCFLSEIKREIQTMRQTEIDDLLTKEIKNFNSSDDEDVLCDVGNETNSDDHSSVPKLSMKMRTIKDINKKVDNKDHLSPIRENEGLNDSHEFIIQNNIKINVEEQLFAKS